MPERSKRIILFDKQKMAQVNQDTLKLLQKYKVDMTLRDLSSKTINGYESDLKQWFIYILDNQDNQIVTELTDDDITEFLYFCKTNGNNVARMKRRMASISAFYKFLRKKRLIIENPMEFIDRPKNGAAIVSQNFLTKEQIELMKRKLIENNNEQLRLYALFSLSTMARANAIVNVRWDMIDFDNRIVSGVLEKGSKIVDLFFNEEVKTLLINMKNYRKKNNINDHGWVFYSNHCEDDKPMNRATLNAWCKKIGDLINVPTLHPHDFRHSGATLLKNAGMPLEDVSALLNHSSTDVTKKFYIREDIKRISQLKDTYEEY